MFVCVCVCVCMCLSVYTWVYVCLYWWLWLCVCLRACVISIVHGVWTGWSEWADCTASCHSSLDSTTSRLRSCSNPAPSSNPAGNKCPGKGTEKKKCDKLPNCPGTPVCLSIYLSVCLLLCFSPFCLPLSLTVCLPLCLYLSACMSDSMTECMCVVSDFTCR